MELTASQIKYLLAVHKLNKNGTIRSADIAGRLAVTRPSAHRMINQLTQLGLLEKERYTSVKITQSGLMLSCLYNDAFFTIFDFLYHQLNIPPESAEDGTLAIIKSLSPDILESVCLQKKLKTDGT